MKKQQQKGDILTEYEIKMMQNQLLSTTKLRKGVKDIMTQFLDQSIVSISLIPSKSKTHGKDNFKPETIFPILLYMLIRTKRLKCSFELYKKNSKTQTLQQIKPALEQAFKLRQFSYSQGFKQMLYDMISSQIKQVNRKKKQNAKSQQIESINTQNKIINLKNHKNQIQMRQKFSSLKQVSSAQNDQHSHFQIQDIELTIVKQSQQQNLIQAYQILNSLFKALRTVFSNRQCLIKRLKLVQIIQKDQEQQINQQQIMQINRNQQYHQVVYQSMIQMFDIIKVNNLKINFGNVEDFIISMHSRQVEKHSIQQLKESQEQKQKQTFQNNIYSINFVYLRRHKINFATVSNLIKNYENLTLLILQHLKRNNETPILYQNCNQLIRDITVHNLYLETFKIKSAIFQDIDILDFQKMIQECPYLTDIEVNTVDKTQYEKMMMTKIDQELFQSKRNRKKQLMNSAMLRGINSQLFIDNIKLLKALDYDYQNILGIIDKIKPIVIPFSVGKKINM